LIAIENSWSQKPMKFLYRVSPVVFACATH